MSTADAKLARILRRDWDAQAALPPLAPDDWTDVVASALDHGVAGLLCRVVSQMGEDDVPPSIVDAAHEYLDHAQRDGESRMRQTLHVVDALEAAGVATLAFKGVVLGALAHGDARIRPSHDIDVLVHRDDMPRAVAALRELGYRQTDTFGDAVMKACYTTYGQDILFAADRLPVEPHWTFVPRPFAVDVDLEGLWTRRKAVPLGERTIDTLSIEDTLLVACLHGAKERWWRMLWVADVAALVARHPDIDWDAIEERARRMGIARMIRLGLGLAQRLFATPLTTSFVRGMRQDATCRRLVDECAQGFSRRARRNEGPLHLSRFHLAVRERAADRGRYLLRTITTPQFKHYRLLALPDALVLGYVPVKLVHDYALLPLWNLGKGRLWKRASTPEADAT